MYDQTNYIPIHYSVKSFFKSDCNLCNLKIFVEPGKKTNYTISNCYDITFSNLYNDGCK